MRKLAIQRKGGRNTYGGTELDWIHINSFDFLDDGNSLVLSSREQSSILKIKNIYTKPELDYVIHRGTIYNGTDIAKYQLKREGDFVANAGQHMITVEYDDSFQKDNIIYICLITTMERQHLFQLLTGVCIRMWETLKVELLITQNFL